VVPAIYKVFTAPHIYASIFSNRHLRRYCRYHDSSMRVILQTVSKIQCMSYRLRYVNCSPGYIQSIYSSSYLCLNIHLNVSSLLLYISHQFYARYTANLGPNTAHILRLTLCDLWFRPYTNYLQLLIVRPQYSTERICAAVGDIPTLRCALYCKLSAKCSADPPVYAMWTVVPAIYKVLTAPHT
jgi:hypothetical protein